MNQSMELKTIRAELSDILQRVECPLTGEEKTAVLDGDKEQADAALASKYLQFCLSLLTQSN